MNYAPLFRGGNADKLSHFRLQKQFQKGEEDRYPVGRYPFKVDISFGSMTSTRVGALRINPTPAICNSADKIRAKVIWGDKVPHAKFNRMKDFVTYKDDSIDGGVFDVEKFESTIGFPAIAKKIRGARGEGFTYINDFNDLEQFLTTTVNLIDYYFEKRFTFDAEFRIHVSPWLKDKLLTYKYTSAGDTITQVRKDGCIFMAKKLIKQEAYDRGIRHYNRGGGFKDLIFSSRFPHVPWMDKAIADAIKAIELLGLDFGFVDLGYNSRTGEYIIFESGANPELYSCEIECYRTAFPHIILYKGKSTGKYKEYNVAAANQQNRSSISLPKRETVKLRFNV